MSRKRLKNAAQRYHQPMQTIVQTLRPQLTSGWMRQRDARALCLVERKIVILPDGRAHEHVTLSTPIKTTLR
jgi:ABC-type thiamine transport system ATPase subunit